MKPTSTLAILSGFFALTYAYILDHTCGPYSDMLLPPIDGAFDLALAGVESLHSLATLNKGSGDIWQAQFNLLKYIFAETLTNNEIDTTNPHWKTVYDTFLSVLRFNTNNERTSQPSSYARLSNDSIVFFCDFTRFTENEDCSGQPRPGRACDTSVLVSFPLSPSFYDCKNGAEGGSGTVLMAGRWVENNRASTVQLCPGFLKEIATYQKKIWDEQGVLFNLAKYNPPVGPGIQYSTQMDGFRTFNAILLHEMTHLVSNVQIVDIDEHNGYGWKNVRRLSDRGTLNADSYGYFGLGSRLISPLPINDMFDIRLEPMSDGSVQLLGAGSKRDISYEPRAINQITTSSSDGASATGPASTASSLAIISTLPPIQTGTCSACLADATSVTATPFYDVGRPESWYATLESLLSEAATNTNDYYTTKKSIHAAPTTLLTTSLPASSSTSDTEDDC